MIARKSATGRGRSEEFSRLPNERVFAGDGAEVMANVTSFDRYPTITESLNHLVPQILKAKRDRDFKPKVSVLSLGCSTGEEVASVAKDIIEVVGRQKLGRVGSGVEVDVLGIDSDAASIRLARKNLAEGFRKTGRPSQDAVIDKINSLGQALKDSTRVRVGDYVALNSIPELGTADIVLVNATVGYAFAGIPHLFDAYTRKFGDRLKSGAVVFSTDPLFYKDLRFTCAQKDHTWIMAKK